MPNGRTRNLHPSLYGSDDERIGEYEYASQLSTRASSHERDDDGASRCHSENRVTDKGTTSKRDEL